ncbi:hypothetical protein ABMA75_03520 [Halobacteriovorax sp. ZH4_bin.1]|uniref:hypothetical protein n=1 Tax=unclassified Halobacteriovorax TaxID=2639665 RepID=UPI0037155CB2
MDNKDIAFNALFARYKESKLAHFYTLQTGGHGEVSKKDTLLEKWANDFIINILAYENGWDIDHAKEVLERGHEDILFVSTDQKTYKVTDDCIEEFFNFIRFRPSKLKYSFTIFKQSQKITQILANKLLKTLEEPPEGHSFIFIKSNDEKTIPTIDSRTIKINLLGKTDSQNETIQELSFKDYVVKNCEDEQLVEILTKVERNNLQLDELRELIKEGPTREANIHHLIASHINQSSKYSIEDAQICLQATKDSTFEIPFNGSSKSRLARLLQLVI